MPTLNVRLASIILISLIVVAGGVHLLHGVQVERQAKALQEASKRYEDDSEAAMKKAASATNPEEKKAARIEGEKDRAEAIRLLRDYVRLAPRDRGAEIHLALLFADAQQLKAAFDFLEEGLRLADTASPPLSPAEIRDARLRMVKDVAIKLRTSESVQAAQAHLEILLGGTIDENKRRKRNGEKPEGDAELLDLYAQLLGINGKDEKDAFEILRDAISIAPDRVDTYWDLARMLRITSGREAEADAVMESMLAKNPKSVSAYEKYVYYYLAQGKKDTIAKAFRKANELLKFAPDNPRGLLLMGRYYFVTQDFNKAEEYLRKGVAGSKEADDITFWYKLLAEAQEHTGKYSKAIETLKQGADATRGTFAGLDLLWTLADVQIIAGNFKDAEQNIKELRADGFSPPMVDFLEGAIAINEQNWPKAERLFKDSVIPRTVDSPNVSVRYRALIYLAQCYAQTNHDVKDRITVLEQAAKLIPTEYRAHATLAEIYMARGRTADAIEQYNEAMKGPQRDEAEFNLARALIVSLLQESAEKKHDWTPVEKLLNDLIARKSARPELYVLKAEMLLGQDKPNEAAEALEESVKLVPKGADAWLALVRLDIHEADKAANSARAMELWKKASTDIDRAEKELGDRFIVRMARGSLALASKDPQNHVGDVLKKLGENTDALNDVEKLQLWSTLGGMCLQANEIDLGRVYLRRVAEKEPKNLRVRSMLCELELRGYEKGLPGDIRELDRLVDEIARLSGLDPVKDEIDQLIAKRDKIIEELKAKGLAPDKINEQLKTLRLTGDQIVERLSDQGPFVLYAKAVRAYVQAKNKDTQLLRDANLYAQAAIRIRNDWAPVVVLAGKICELQEEADQALAYYTHAIYALSDRDVDVIGRTVRLLVPRRRFDEAKALFDYLEKQKSSLVEEMHQDYVFVKVFRCKDDEIAEAELLVEKSVAPDSKSYKDLAWQGELYYILTNRLKAIAQKKADPQKSDDWTRDAAMLAMAQRSLQSLYKAKGIDPQAAEVWVALAQLLADIGQPKSKAASAILAEAEQTLHGDKAPMTIGICCELLAQPEKAEENYKAAIKAFPQNSRYLRQLAYFYLRTGKPASAEPLLRNIIALQSAATLVDTCWARRNLAIILRGRDFEGLREAVTLLDANLASNAASTEDKRLRVRYLMAEPGKEKLEEAVAGLADLVKAPDATPDDHFSLAQLYMRKCDLETDIGEKTRYKAAYEDQMRVVLGSNHVQPRYLVSYIMALMDRKEYEDADRWLGTMEKAIRDPHDPGVKIQFNPQPEPSDALQIRAEYLYRRGQYRELADKAESYVYNLNPQAKDRGAQIHFVAGLLEAFGGRLKADHQPVIAAEFLSKADNLFQLLGRSSKLAVDGYVVYAAFLARQGRIDEALTVLDQSWDRSHPELIQMPAFAIIKNSAVTPQQTARLEKMLVDAQKAKPSNMLLMVLATLYEQQKQYNKAIATYREALVTEPKNYKVLNNIAVDLLLGGGDLSEALSMVNRALDITGQMAAVLDSRAMIYVERQDYAKALDDLNVAVKDEGSAEQYLHLAWVLSLMGRNEDASAAFKTSQSKGLDPKLLNAKELQAYDKLKDLM
jgi:tetratricopeptide (TPR) repeat protein